MIGFLRRSGIAGVVASLTLAWVSSAVGQKAGGVLRVFQYDSPASLSIHEEALNSAQNPAMAIFNNLVIFDQHERQIGLTRSFPIWPRIGPEIPI